MNTRIATIETAGRGLGARRIVLDDTTQRVVAAATVKALDLEVGDSFREGELEAALARVEPELVRERALRLLGHRERSAMDLVQRLTDAGFPRALVQETVESLERVGAVDDTRFAEMWSRSRVTSGYGSRRIRRELMERGIDEAVAEAALLAALDGVDDTARARTLVGHHPPADRRERERLLRRLLAKGYDMSVAVGALDATDVLSSEDVTFPDE